MWRVILIASALWLGAGCGDSDAPARDATLGDVGADADTIDDADARADGAGDLARACLDDPSTLARPPRDALPCDLFPPDFAIGAIHR